MGFQRPGNSSPGSISTWDAIPEKRPEKGREDELPTKCFFSFFPFLQCIGANRRRFPDPGLFPTGSLPSDGVLDAGRRGIWLGTGAVVYTTTYSCRLSSFRCLSGSSMECHPRLASLHGGVDEGGDGGDGCAGFLGATDWRLVLPAIGLHAFSAGSGVGGDWRLMVVVEGAVCGFGDSVGGPSNDEIFLVAFSCVVARFFCGFLVSGGTNALRCPVGLDANDMAIGGWTIFCSLQGAASVDCGCLVRFVSQHEKSGWFFSPTFLGGLLPLLDVPSFGQMGVLADLVASGLCPSGEAMAGGHLQRPEHSAVSRYMPMQSTCYSWCQLKIMFRREGDQLQAAEGCSDRRRRV